jgi:hypothetical protein
VGESASAPELFFRERVTAAATDLEICFPSHFWTQVESYKKFWREANKLDVGAAISKHRFLLLFSSSSASWISARLAVTHKSSSSTRLQLQSQFDHTS